MKAFCIRAYLDTQIIQQGYLTLDSLLMAELECGDVSHLLARDAQLPQLYDASAAMPVLVAGKSVAAFSASMRPLIYPEWAELIRPNTRDGDVRIGSARRSEAGNVVNAYTALAATAVEWTAVGHAQAVLEVVRSIRFIGKRRSSGFGQVTRWEVSDGGPGGLVGHFAEPLRPIPVDRWAAMGGDPECLLMEAAWKGPYWEVRNRTCCAVPGLPGEGQ
jgi:hypothetical protein